MDLVTEWRAVALFRWLQLSDQKTPWYEAENGHSLSQTLLDALGIQGASTFNGNSGSDSGRPELDLALRCLHLLEQGRWSMVAWNK